MRSFFFAVMLVLVGALGVHAETVYIDAGMSKENVTKKINEWEHGNPEMQIVATAVHCRGGALDSFSIWITYRPKTVAELESESAYKAKCAPKK